MLSPTPLYHMIRIFLIFNLFWVAFVASSAESVSRESKVHSCGRMIVRAKFLGLRLPIRFRHSTTSMHFPARYLPPLTRCKPAHYASKRGFNAFQRAPRLKPRLAVASPSRASCSNVPPFVCRRMLHASFGEPLSSRGCPASPSDELFRISGSARACDPAKAWNRVGPLPNVRPQRRAPMNTFPQDQNIF